jgi:heme-degrading monooxygenase HmoA
LQTAVFPELARLPGFVRATILSRSVDHGTEFQIVTEWTSLDAIKAFAGDSVETAVVAPRVKELMDSYDAGVVHYEVVNVFEPQADSRS